MPKLRSFSPAGSPIPSMDRDFVAKQITMPTIKGYTLYFYSQNNSCLTYFGVDGTSKKKILKLGKDMAKLLEEYYAAAMWPIKITVKVEEFKP